MVSRTTQPEEIPNWVNNLNSEVEASRGKNQKNWIGKLLGSFSSMGDLTAATVSTSLSNQSNSSWDHQVRETENKILSDNAFPVMHDHQGIRNKMTTTVNTSSVIDAKTTIDSLSKSSPKLSVDRDLYTVRDQLDLLRKTPNEATLAAIEELEDSLTESKLELAKAQSDQDLIKDQYMKTEKQLAWLRDEYLKTEEDVSKAKQQLEECKRSVLKKLQMNQAKKAQGNSRTNAPSLLEEVSASCTVA